MKPAQHRAGAFNQSVSRSTPRHLHKSLLHREPRVPRELINKRSIVITPLHLNTKRTKIANHYLRQLATRVSLSASRHSLATRTFPRLCLSHFASLRRKLARRCDNEISWPESTLRKALVTMVLGTAARPSCPSLISILEGFESLAQYAF
jgi:cyanate permease